jgi:hypothetical protein
MQAVSTLEDLVRPKPRCNLSIRVNSKGYAVAKRGRGINANPSNLPRYIRGNLRTLLVSSPQLPTASELIQLI